MPLTNINSDWMPNGFSSLCIMILCYEQSNRTPRCSLEVSGAGLTWLKHFRVQCYTQVKSLLKCYLATRPGFCATNLLEVESLRV